MQFDRRRSTECRMHVGGGGGSLWLLLVRHAPLTKDYMIVKPHVNGSANRTVNICAVAPWRAGVQHPG